MQPFAVLAYLYPMYRGLVLLLMMLCVFAGSYAQVDNRMLEREVPVQDTADEALFFSVENRNFFRNNEYFSPLCLGYTLMGTQLQPELAWQPGPKLRLQAGLMMQLDFGNNRLQQLSPVYTLKYAHNGISALFGTLEGNVSHRLIEPLYHYERYMRQPLEYGLQFKVNRERIWSDTWINWERMQYLGSPFQERFSAGHHSQIRVLARGKWMLTLPVQALVTHRGGQIDTVSMPLETLLNAAAGFQLSVRPGNWWKEFRTENYVVLYRDLSPTPQNVYRQGSGLMLNLTAQTRHDISATLGYWKGQRYQAGRGAYLFQSVASEYGVPGFIARDRELYFLRLLWQRPVYRGLRFDLRFEPYYDRGLDLFEYSYALFLSYRHDFEILNLRNRKGRNSGAGY